MAGAPETGKSHKIADWGSSRNRAGMAILKQRELFEGELLPVWFECGFEGGAGENALSNSVGDGCRSVRKGLAESGGALVSGCRLSGDKINQCRVLRDVIPPIPPGPEGSNGNGLVRAQ